MYTTQIVTLLQIKCNHRPNFGHLFELYSHTVMKDYCSVNK